jgi:hypothetical protein
MSNVIDPFLLEPQTGDTKMHLDSELVEGRLVFICNKVRSVAVGSGTDPYSTVVVAALQFGD